ncbi:MAG: hypothetical protein GSR79_00800 [Desulfurococcales archaeon]|nr:hypothetical protein [Desulfurococcales archaeon]
MVLEYVKRLLGVRAKPDPRELLGLLHGDVPFDLYTLLEDEKISRELWPYVLGFAARDTKLTYFTEKDERYLFWKIEGLATRIGLALNAQTPLPERFSSLEDYVKHMNANQLDESIRETTEAIEALGESGINPPPQNSPVNNDDVEIILEE